MSSIRRLESVRRLEQMKKESTGPVNFGQKLLTCCCGGGTLGLLCLLVLLLIGLFAMNIAKICIGALYLNFCPAQPLVPIYLIVGGVISLAFNCSCRPQKSEEGTIKVQCQGCAAILGLLVGLFSLSWLIAGTIFVVQTRNAIEGCSSSLPIDMTTVSTSAMTSLPTTEPTTEPTTIPSLLDILNTTSSPTNPTPASLLNAECPSCNDLVLTFAFVTIMIEWGFLILLLVLSCCVCCLPFCLALCAGPQ